MTYCIGASGNVAVRFVLLIPAKRYVGKIFVLVASDSKDRLLCELHRVSKNCAKLFLSEVRQISTNFDNFWQKDGKAAKFNFVCLQYFAIH